MGYSKELVERIRDLLADEPGLSGKPMFGSYGFFLDGNMCCGVKDDRLLMRTRPADYRATLTKVHVHRFPDEGKAMNNWVTVDDAAFPDDEALWQLLAGGIQIARELPPK